MPNYRYEAVTTAGETIKGDVQALDQAAVVKRLQKSGHIVLRTYEVKPGRLGDLLNRELWSTRRLRRNEIALFTTELSSLIGAGLMVDRALGIMSAAAGSDRIKQFHEGLLSEITDGSSLCNALRAQSQQFGDEYLAIVEAGEASGQLDVVLERLADYLEKAEALRASIRTAMTYPIILLGFAGLTVLLLVTAVLPRFQSIFDKAGQVLPMPTQLLLATSSFLAQWWWVLAILTVVILLIVNRILATESGRLGWDRAVLLMPIWGDLVRESDTARMARVLGTLLANGVTMLQALSIVGGTLRNTALSQAMDTVKDQVSDGKTLSSAISMTGLFPQLAVQLIHVGDETGKVDEMLVKIADLYDTGVKRVVDRFMALLVPIVTILLGTLIAAIISSVLVAVLRINDFAI